MLRSQGRAGEARLIEETELSAAREAGPADGARLDAVMAEEAERVAGAVALAEVLAPMLLGRLGAREPARGRAAPRPAPRVSAPPDGSGETRDIADFIDEMLAQDRAISP